MLYFTFSGRHDGSSIRKPISLLDVMRRRSLAQSTRLFVLSLNYLDCLNTHKVIVYRQSYWYNGSSSVITPQEVKYKCDMNRNHGIEYTRIFQLHNLRLSFSSLCWLVTHIN